MAAAISPKTGRQRSAWSRRGRRRHRRALAVCIDVFGWPDRRIVVCWAAASWRSAAAGVVEAERRVRELRVLVCGCRRDALERPEIDGELSFDEGTHVGVEIM